MTRSISTLASYANDIIWAVGGLAAAIMVVVIVGIMLHRRFAHSQSNDHTLPPFDLHQLRQMRDNGQLTEAEYDRALASLVARQSAADHSPPTNPSSTTAKQQSD